MYLTRFSVPLLLATASLTAGCGSLDGHTGTPTVLSTMHGELVGIDSLPHAGNIRVAVVWTPAGQVSVSEDLPVQPVFPWQFVIELDQPPPESAIIRVDQYSDVAPPDFRLAYGAIIAYEDRNGNGALDLVADSAGAFVDRVVGANPNLAIIYLENPPANPKVHGPWGAGYRLIGPDPACSTADSGAGASCDSGMVFPIDTDYSLTVSDDPEVNALMCESHGMSDSASGAGGRWQVDLAGAPPGGYPEPGAAGLVCAPDGGSYSFSQCQSSSGLCKRSTNCVDWMVYLGGVAKPAGWPCP